MRTTVLGAAAAAVAVVLTGLPSAAPAATRVDGNHFGAAKVEIVSQGCLNPDARPDPAPKLRIVRDKDAPLGQGAVGWSPADSSYGIGPTTHVASPYSLSQLSISVRPKDSGVSGQAVVLYTPPGDTGYWNGRYQLSPDSAQGWHTVSAQVSSVLFQWRHYNSSGLADADAPNAVLSDFVSAHGGDGSGAWVGFMFGCEGRAFDVDNLVATTSDQSRVVNFEGFGSRAKLTRGGKTKKIVLIAGATKKLTASLHTMTGQALPGRVALQRKTVHHKKYDRAGKVKIGKSGKAGVKIKPIYSASYRVSYPGTSKYAGSTSKTIKVLVHTNVRARFADPSVVQGSSFSVVGRFWPGRATTLWLQKYVNHEWTTVRKFRSARDGTYRVSAAATRVGKSFWRVWNPPGGGNLSGRSPAMKLTTNPKPHHSGGGSTPTNPDPPTNDPTQPPPPTGPL
ncbi:hypothetical protein [Nocardioides mangrovi]|uniref:Ig-like domain repeat protein n=1 Tax=Nocardioides mangrovi TaxID=2874580 RepID=A0ABS7UHC8_9ACTN|nr:hypothetical protein [Nocardioides mangrovi]MBZ5740076.1 hypothetical protein [Nocardioides mangrovi]